MRAVFAAALLGALLPRPSSLQAQKGGTLSGLVRDSAFVPIAGADVWMLPGGRRTRTDSAGRYTIAGVDNGSYQVTARKLGFAPEVWDAKLSAEGRLELNFTLRRRTELDTVRVVGRKGCDGFGVTGFECRRVAGGGQFFDYPEIDEKNRIFVADLFRDIPGFSVTLRQSPRSGDVSPVIRMHRPYRCLASYVDGRPANITNPIPELTRDLVALEIYPLMDSIPLAKKTDLRTVGSPLAVQRCGVVVYWTQNAPADMPPPPSRFRAVGQ